MPEDYSEEIAEIRERLNSGITEFTQDGQVVKISLEQQKQRLEDLLRLSGQKKPRQRFRTFNLRNF